MHLQNRTASFAATLAITCALAVFIPRHLQIIAKERCIRNLGYIRGAKVVWQIEHGNDKRALTLDDLRPYLANVFFDLKRQNEQLCCPRGGIYKIGTINELPTCSIPSHTLSSGKN